jgi:hypothetical protein
MRDKVNKLTPGANLLWESSRMMLPEHKEAIARHRRELQRKEKPVLDEQRLIELSHVLSEARQRRLDVRLVLYDPYAEQVLTGRIIKIDPVQRKMRLATAEGEVWISLDDILDARVAGGHGDDEWD